MNNQGVMMLGVVMIFCGVLLFSAFAIRQDGRKVPSISQGDWLLQGEPKVSVEFKSADDALSDYTIEWETRNGTVGWAAWYRRNSGLRFDRIYLGSVGSFQDAEKICLKHAGEDE